MILLTGASGFVGCRIADRLVGRGSRLRCLVLPGDNAAQLSSYPVEIVRGDVTEPRSLEGCETDVDTIVHCAALMLPNRAEDIRRVNVDGTANLIRFAQRHGIRRFVYLSAVSAVYRQKNSYGLSKAAAEEMVTTSGLDYTILRPTMIYGKDGGSHFQKLASLIRSVPLVTPVLGPGTGALQPVWIEDTVTAVELVLGRHQALNKTYNVSGATVVTFNQLVDHVAAALEVRRIKLHIPLGLCQAAARLLNAVAGPSFLSPEALSGINENAALDHGDFTRECDYRPCGLAQGLAHAFAADDSFAARPAIEIEPRASDLPP